MLDGELVTDVERLEALAPEWDALAVAVALPQMSPAWVLAWWRHVAPAGVVPRTVAVREGGALVGIAPYYVDATAAGRVDYRLPGIELTGRLAPLAPAGRERDVAAAIGRALAGASPRPEALLFEAAAAEPDWSGALRSGWPGSLRPPLQRTRVDGSPFVSLREASFDAWLDGKSSNFRSQMRRLRRRFAQAGGSARVATRATLAVDAAAFTRLHAGRWQDRGHSNLSDLGAHFSALIVDAGERLLDERRLTLRTLELDGEPICSQLFIEAGGRMLFVNGGWDERHAALKPSMVGLLDAVEDAFERGSGQLDLGVGEQSYKQRFADGDDALQWAMLLAPGRRLPLSIARSAPTLLRAQLRTAALRGLSNAQTERLRRLRRRLHSDAA